MRYKTDELVLQFDGEPIPRNTPNEPGPITLRFALIQACLAANPQKHATGDAKYEIHQLISRIHAAGEHVEFTAKEVTKLKELVGEFFRVVVVGPVFEILERPLPEAPTAA